MKDLELHENLEMQVLEEMRKLKVLDQLVFGGGTMLRLCHDLPRFSVDFDFYLKKEPKEFKIWIPRLQEMFTAMGAKITDQEEKRNTFLFEIQRAGFPRRLVIEIRKNPVEARETELSVAHSKYADLQVRLRALILPQMFRNKVRALLYRHEIRDAYDLEFLMRRDAGDFRRLSSEDLKSLLKKLESYTEQDFKVKLGSLLPAEERRVVLSNRFSYLKAKIREAMAK